MRLLIVCLLLTATCCGQDVLRQPVQLVRQSGTTGQFLDDLNNLPGISISYSSGIVELTRKVSLSGQEKVLEDVLRSILKGQPVKYLQQEGKIFLVAEVASKKKYTLSGYITDKISGERLIGASLYIPSRQAGTTSNNYGFFSLTLEQDTVHVQVSYTGYLVKALQVNLQTDMVLNLAMERNIETVETVVVNTEGRKNTQNRTLVGKTDVTQTMIKSVSPLLGEPDVLKTMQMLPGIQAGTEGTAGLNVRGGSADQNLVLVDGMPVYNSSHAFGLFSIFNADAVNNVEVLKSGFPASYGGRLSSVIDVHLKEGDKYRYHGEAGVGLIFSKLTLEGPIQKGKSSFLVSLRRTYVDLIMNAFQGGAPEKIFPFFSDVNAKANFTVGKKDHVYFSVYTGVDKLNISDEYYSEHEGISYYSVSKESISWGNTTAMMRWNHIFNKKLFSNFTFMYSRYRFKTSEWDLSFDSATPDSVLETKYYRSGIRDWSVKADIDYLPAPNHFVKAGLAGTLHRYQPGLTQFYQSGAVIVNSQIESSPLQAAELDAYIEDDVRLNHRMKANVGLRVSAFVINNRLFPAVQPRLNWLYKLDDRWQIKATFSQMNQFIHMLTNSSLGLPTDLWVPVTERVPPQVSQQIAAGISYSYEKNIELSMELYYKRLKNVIDYGSGSVFYNASDNWENMVETGVGKAYGVEWLVQKKRGVVTGHLSYTLSESMRRFDNIDNGKWFPFKYDRRHELKTLAIWHRSPRFECSAGWFFATGAAMTMPVAYYYDPRTGRRVEIYNARNNYRMPVYHRLDLSVKFMKQKRHYLRTWLISIYNVYNRLNPFFIYNGYEGMEDRIDYQAMAVFPVIPSVSFNIKF
jgi:outer membrane receptor for ferrienterochelin and colicin